MDLEQFAALAHADGYGDNTIAMLKAYYRCRNLDDKDTYMAATADALGIDWFPSKKRKKEYDLDNKATADAVGIDWLPSKKRKKEYSTADLDVGVSYRVETLRDDGDVEPGYFRKDASGVTWYYTRDQIADVFQPPPNNTPNALWISSHKEPDFDTGCPFEKISLDTYSVVGVFKAQDPMSFNIIEDYVSVLCARGGYPSKRLCDILKRTADWKERPVGRTSDKCSACGLTRKIKYKVRLGDTILNLGPYCYDRVHLAHQMLHMSDDIHVLLDKFFDLI